MCSCCAQTISNCLVRRPQLCHLGRNVGHTRRVHPNGRVTLDSKDNSCCPPGCCVSCSAGDGNTHIHTHKLSCVVYILDSFVVSSVCVLSAQGHFVPLMYNYNRMA